MQFKKQQQQNSEHCRIWVGKVCDQCMFDNGWKWVQIIMLRLWYAFGFRWIRTVFCTVLWLEQPQITYFKAHILRIWMQPSFFVHSCPPPCRVKEDSTSSGHRGRQRANKEGERVNRCAKNSTFSNSFANVCRKMKQLNPCCDCSEWSRKTGRRRPTARRTDAERETAVTCRRREITVAEQQ